MSDDQRAASGSVSLPLGARDENWDAAAAKKALHPDDYAKAFFWVDPSGDPKTLAAYKLPFASPNGGLHAVWAGVTAAAAAIQGSQGGVQIPAADVPGVKRKIAAYYRKAAEKYNDDGITPPWLANTLDELALVARDGSPDDVFGHIREIGWDGVLQVVADYRSSLADRGLGLWMPVPNAEVRGFDGGTGDGSYTIDGMASVAGHTTTLYDGASLRITEEIAAGAFDRALDDPDILAHLNHGHDMRTAIASTDVPPNQIGGLSLSKNPSGLPYFARVDREDPDAHSLAVKLRRGVVRGASFAFRIGNETRTETEDSESGKRTVHYRVNEVAKLFDVCPCAQGAYRIATSNLRSTLHMLDLGHASPNLAGHERHTPVGVIPAAESLGVVEDSEQWEERRREIARARAYQELAESKLAGRRAHHG